MFDFLVLCCWVVVVEGVCSGVGRVLSVDIGGES